MRIDAGDVDCIPLVFLYLLSQLGNLRRFLDQHVVFKRAGRSHRRPDTILLVAEYVGVFQPARRALDEQNLLGRARNDGRRTVAEETRNEQGLKTTLAAGRGADQVLPGEFGRGFVNSGCVGVAPVPVVQFDFDAVDKGQLPEEVAMDADAVEVFARPVGDRGTKIRVGSPPRPTAQDIVPLLCQTRQSFRVIRSCNQHAVLRADRDEPFA